MFKMSQFNEAMSGHNIDLGPINLDLKKSLDFRSKTELTKHDPNIETSLSF